MAIIVDGIKNVEKEKRKEIKNIKKIKKKFASLTREQKDVLLLRLLQSAGFDIE